MFASVGEQAARDDGRFRVEKNAADPVLLVDPYSERKFVIPVPTAETSWAKHIR
jgi:hypothetical protein